MGVLVLAFLQQSVFAQRPCDSFLCRSATISDIWQMISAPSEQPFCMILVIHIDFIGFY